MWGKTLWKLQSSTEFPLQEMLLFYLNVVVYMMNIIESHPNTKFRKFYCGDR